MKKEVHKTKSELYDLPNIGPKSVAQLESIGIKTIKQFQKIGPEKIYEKCSELTGTHIHRAFLYVLRAAHFWSYNRDRRKEALRWWMWKDIKPVRFNNK